MKTLTLLALTNGILARSRDATTQPCPPENAETVTEGNCYRELTFIDKGGNDALKFRYYVDMKDDVPTFFGHFDLLEGGKDGKGSANEKSLEGSSTRSELRLCLELGIEGQE